MTISISYVKFTENPKSKLLTKYQYDSVKHWSLGNGSKVDYNQGKKNQGLHDCLRQVNFALGQVKLCFDGVVGKWN